MTSHIKVTFILFSTHACTMRVAPFHVAQHPLLRFTWLNNQENTVGLNTNMESATLKVVRVISESIARTEKVHIDIVIKDDVISFHVVL